MTKAPQTAFEYSAGGVATENGKVLVVQVKSLQGQVLWTFPKGHLEPGESPREAALREVKEETGYPCEILEPLTVVRYHFMKGERRINKRVRWYWMRPVGGPGPHDADEVLRVEWMNVDALRDCLRYPGDLRLLELVLRRAGKGQEAVGP